ncbi:hypothetical protein [Sabulicella glaciei]|uniref:Uncharacterized protein n=1 Tax=Sabulicella glaciei TaxID=2984948 RepID=A0ABT3NXJ4_9PROT|nr:hypothetical protein [Roseococcus sp. MDT2-1-1]MCW8086879.1 hypothetical protein [Roseococcus sp. MDT2-1-1]
MRDPRRLLLALSTVPLLAAGAAAQDRAAQQPALTDCSVVQSDGLRAPAEAASIGLAFLGDGPERHVVAAQPRTGQAPAPRTSFRAARPGVSYGAGLEAPSEAEPGPQTAFTLVTLEQTGMVLLETWRWRTAQSGELSPAYSWARLRCGA